MKQNELYDRKIEHFRRILKQTPSTMRLKISVEQPLLNEKSEKDIANH